MNTAITDLVNELIDESKRANNATHVQMLLLLAADTISKQQDMLVKTGEMIDKTIETLDKLESFRKMDFGKTVN